MPVTRLPLLSRILPLATALVAASAAHAFAVAEPGPYGVGVRTIVLTDASRPTMPYGPYEGSPVRELPTEVWYPADTGQGLTPVRDAEPVITDGPYPLVVRAHGLGARRSDSVYLTAFLASRGYVVAAPDFPLSKRNTPALVPTIYDIAEQPGDLSFVIDSMLAASSASEGFLAGLVDGTRIGTLGHSLGGLTVLLHGYAAGFADARVRAVAALAPWACSLQEPLFEGSRVPSLWMGGTADLVTPYAENQRSPFTRAPAPKVLVTLELGTHLEFATVPFEIEPEDEGRSPDDLFCDGTFGLAGLRPFRAPKLPVEMGDEPQVDQSTCGNVCPAWDGAFMDEDRQHDLTREAVASFFDAELEGSAAAHAALVGLRSEPDVDTVEIPGSCAFGSCEVGGDCVACGQPASHAGDATTADALLVLRAAVGAATCRACVCDVDASSDVTASDATRVLRRAVGLASDLACLRDLP